MVVGDGAKRAANRRLGEQQRKHEHQDGGGAGGDQVELVQQHAADLKRPLRNPDIELAHVAAPYHLTKALEEEGEADRRHEKDDFRLVDQRPQHQAFDGDRQQYHSPDREEQGEPNRYAIVHQADEGQRREQHHDALSEVEDARSLEDQDEPERHQGVHEAGDDSACHHLGEKDRRRHDIDDRVDEDTSEKVHDSNAP